MDLQLESISTTSGDAESTTSRDADNVTSGDAESTASGDAASEGTSDTGDTNKSTPKAMQTFEDSRAMNRVATAPESKNRICRFYSTMFNARKLSKQPPTLNGDVHYLIAQKLPLATLCNFALCSRQTLDASQPLFRMYRKRLNDERYNTLTLLKSCQDDELTREDADASDLPSFLADQAMDDSIGRFVKHIVLRSHSRDAGKCKRGDCGSYEEDIYDNDLRPGIRGILGTLASKTDLPVSKLRSVFPGVTPTKQRFGTQKTLDFCDVMCLLLFSLPNIATLELRNFTDAFAFFPRLVERMDQIEGYQRLRVGRKFRPLSKLTTLIIDSYSLKKLDQYTHDPQTIHDVMRFSSFPTLKHLIYRPIEGLYTYPGRERDRTVPSSIERISIMGSIQHRPILSFFLRCCDGLKPKSFDWDSGITGIADQYVHTGPNLNIDTILLGLADDAGEALRTLWLTDRQHEDPLQKGLDLRRFVVLGQLTLWSNQVVKTGTKTCVLKLNESFFVPPSLERLNVWDFGEMEDVTKILDALAMDLDKTQKIWQGTFFHLEEDGEPIKKWRRYKRPSKSIEQTCTEIVESCVVS